MAKAFKNDKTLPAHGAGCCRIQDLLARLGDKWSMLTIVTLSRADGACLRFSELMRQINGISQRMLTTTLRALERDGMISRKLYPEVPPRVEYTLTARGNEMLVPVRTLVGWLERQWPAIEQSRKAYDVRNTKGET